MRRVSREKKTDRTREIIRIPPELITIFLLTLIAGFLDIFLAALIEYFLSSIISKILMIALGIAGVKEVSRRGRIMRIPYRTDGTFASKKEAAAILSFSNALTMIILVLMLTTQINKFVLYIISMMDTPTRWGVSLFVAAYHYFDLWRNFY